MKQKLTMFLMTLLFLLIVAPVSAQVSPVDAYKTTGKYMVEAVPNPTFGDEWFIIALARGEYDVPTNYYETYYSNQVLRHYTLPKGRTDSETSCSRTEPSLVSLN